MNKNLDAARRTLGQFLAGFRESVDEVAPEMIQRISHAVIFAVVVGPVASAAGAFQASGGILYWAAYLMVLSGATSLEAGLAALTVALVVAAGMIIIVYIGATSLFMQPDHDELNDDLEELRDLLTAQSEKLATITEHVEGLTVISHVRPARNGRPEPAPVAHE